MQDNAMTAETTEQPARQLGGLSYKGFTSTPEYDAERGTFFGLVNVASGLAEYESKDPDGLEQAFCNAVDDYIDACAESGIPCKKR